jgi:hypothetical protein
LKLGRSLLDSDLEDEEKEAVEVEMEAEWLRELRPERA